MPSGAKKRKAAKKKENQSSNNPNPSSASTHGVDEVRHQEDRESDAGEVSSPASQDHHSHQSPLTEAEEEAIEERGKGVKIEVVGEPNVATEESVIPVERNFKIEDESDKKDQSFEHDEAPRKSYDGGPSGSSSSSSSSSNSSDDESHGIKNDQPVVDVSPVTEAIESHTTEEAGDSVPQNIPDVVSGKISLSGEKAEVESVFKENGEKKPSSVKDEVVISQEEEAIVQSVQRITPIPYPKECIVQETDDRLTVSYNAPIATADNGAADTEKDSGVAQPLLAPARPVQTTSWKGCCGLFEVFTGSGR